MSRLTKRMLEMNKKQSHTSLQLTSMVDMFTILLVFLLKSFSTSAVNPTLDQSMRLPTSTSSTEAVEALKLVVSKDGIYVDNDKIIEIKDGIIADPMLDKDDRDLISRLHETLEKSYKQSSEIAGKNTSLKFTGQIFLQADEGLSYETLRKVIYTASVTGYHDLKLATMSADQ